MMLTLSIGMASAKVDKQQVTFYVDLHCQGCIDKIYKNKEIQCFIEYQGSQHYFPFEYFGGEEGLKIRKERDYRKKILTQKYNIPLIEIPYTDLSKLNKEYFINLLKENNIDIIN